MWREAEGPTASSTWASTAGCFVTGAKPFWVVLCHGHVRVHPMLLDAATAFTSFHNVNCKRGFIYSTAGKVNAKSL